MQESISPATLIRRQHIVHILIRRKQGGQVEFFVYPHDKWKDPNEQPYWTLATKRTVTDPLAPFLQGTSIEAFVDHIVQEDLQLDPDTYALEQELEPTEVKNMPSPTHGDLTDYTIYPIDIWVHPDQHEPMRVRLKGEWLSADRARVDPRLSPTTRAVFDDLLKRDARLQELYRSKPDEARKPDAPRLLLTGVSDEPSMDALAKKWFSKNKVGVRHLPKKTLDQILDAGNRAFNLRVADPYLRYQLQGVGFTWSFFTHKDLQDVHVHGAPVVEIYGVLEGRLEIWWKPYYDRGTSAWCHRVLETGDWIEVDSLQCHIVNWLGEGKGVVFKAGPGPLAEVGRLGVKGKTPCKDCPCMKPPQVLQLERSTPPQPA